MAGLRPSGLPRSGLVHRRFNVILGDNESMEKSVQSYSYRFAAQPRAASTIVLVAALSPRRLAAAAPCYAASRCKSATAWFCECSSNSSKC
jgi:hypothetical protein